ncbi:integrase, catalytic region, zinc finger, CCHC-type containing protein [Tanacetum coccineum]
MAIIQPTNIDSEAGPSYNSAFLSEVQTPSTSYFNPLFARDNQEQQYLKQPKIINNTNDAVNTNIIFDAPNDAVNSGNVEEDNNVQQSYELEQLARNAYREAKKQQIIAKKVQQQNIVLTKQLELYKEKVRVFEMTKGNITNYFNEYNEADRKAKRFEQESQSQFIRDRDIIRYLKQQRDKLDLNVVELKRQTVELQKTQSILKRKMSENEDKYHDTVLDLKAKVKKNVDTVLKIVQTLIKERDTVKIEYQKLFDSIKKTRAQTQGGINNLIENVKQKTYAYADVRAQNKDLLMTISKLKSRLTNVENGLSATSSVRRPLNRNSSFKNSVISNTKNSSEKVEVSDRTNQKQDVASKNVALNTIVTNDEIKNALIEKNVLCVSCAKNVLIQCLDNCLAKYKLNVHSKVRRALFTTPRTVKSMFKDTTLVVSKTRFSVRIVQSTSLDTTPVVSKDKIDTVTPLSDKNKLTGYSDYVQGNIMIFHVYYVEGLEGDDLLIGDHESNLYTISIPDMAASSPICLMSKASLTKSWLWHRRLSHLNFGTINDLTKHDLVDGLSKFKYGKDHLCFVCDRGKSKKSSHPPKVVPSTHCKLELLHMDLWGPMRVGSINGKKYILVIVGDYSRFTWMKPKSDIGIFTGYSETLVSLLVHYVTFNDDSSAELMNTPSKEDLDNLFGPMYNEYFEKKSSDMPINSAAQQVHNHEDSSSTSLIDIEAHKATPIVTTFEEQTSPISLTMADELYQEDSAKLDGNTLLTPYDAPNFSKAESSTNLDPSNMHEFHKYNLQRKFGQKHIL